MTLNDFANIAIIVQGIFVIVSIGFIWYQLRENTRLTRAANTQKLIELSSPFNLQLIQNREMAELYIRGAKEYDKMDEIDKSRYYDLLTWWLLLHENIYHQRSRKLVSKETYTAWDSDLQHFVSAQNVAQHWDRMKNVFEASFAEHVSQLIVDRKRKLETGEEL